MRECHSDRNADGKKTATISNNMRHAVPAHRFHCAGSINFTNLTEMILDPKTKKFARAEHVILQPNTSRGSYDLPPSDDVYHKIQ